MHDDALQPFFTRDDDTLSADPEWPAAHAALLDALEAGRLRAAVRTANGSWSAHAWVKRAILLGFQRTALVSIGDSGLQPFYDKTAYPPRRLRLVDGVRLVPGGSAIRRGAHVAAGVVIMPPAYVNVGAYVAAGTMVDSHALVGSCAQIGANVHLSAGAQIGGVLEPIHQSPVIIEDDVFVGGLCGVFEGVLVRERAVLAAGVILTAATVVHDLVRGCEVRREIPAGAVVIPGSRPAGGDYAAARGLQVAAPLIVKYRDERTNAATALESALR